MGTVFSKDIIIPKVSKYDNRFDSKLRKSEKSFKSGKLEESYKEIISYIDKTNFRYSKPFLLLSKIMFRKSKNNLSKNFQLIGKLIKKFEEGELKDKDLLQNAEILKKEKNNLCKLFYVFTLKMNGKFEEAIDFIQENFHGIELENRINYYYMLYSLNRDIKNFDMAFSIYQNIKNDDFLSKKYIVTGYAEYFIFKNKFTNEGINLILDSFKYEDELLQTNGKTKKANINGKSFHSLLCFLLSFFFKNNNRYEDYFRILLYGLKILPTDKELKTLLIKSLKDNNINKNVRNKYILKIKQ